jgi:hypothetical protein
MNLKERMDRDEAELKLIIERLNGLRANTPLRRGEREQTLYALTTKLVETRCFVDEWLCGRADHERSALAYKIRVEYPVYSHLDSLASLSGEFVDWSVRDFSLTLAAAQ